MKLRVLLLVAFVLGVNYGVSNGDCPPQEFIEPCRCYIPPYNLVCNDIQDVDDLRKIAINMQGVPSYFAKLWITNSTLQYLPKELLENIRVRELNFENVLLAGLFNSPPTSLEFFERIRLQNVNIRSEIVWAIFRQMVNLKSITIESNLVSAIGKGFKDNVPHKLEELQLYSTRTKHIEIGAFESFSNLKTIDLYNNRIEKLERGYFPTPFNVEKFYFAKNKIQTIPDDMFTNMPKLDDIILFENQISTVPESAFGGNFNQIQRLYLRDNPLKCDCNLRWIVAKKPQWFDGTCVSPKIMHGKELKNLYWEQFFCDQ